MTASTSSLTARAASWRRSRNGTESDEGGFALVLVLGVIALTSTVIIALLGLAFTSARVTDVQRERARDQRAAAGALEVAIGQIARIEDDDPCPKLLSTATAPLVFESGGVRPGVSVELECAAVPWADPSAPPEAPTQPTLTSMTPPPNVGTQHRFATVNLLCGGWLPACNATRTFSTRWSASGADLLTSAVLLFESNEGENVHNLNRNLTVAVSTANGSCSVTAPGGRSNSWANVFTAVELFTSPDCVALLEGEPESALNGATIAVTHTYVVPFSGCVPACEAALTVGDVQLLTNGQVLEASTVPSAGGFSNHQSARTVDAVRTEVPQSSSCVIAEERCRKQTPGQTFSLQLEGFDASAIDGVGPESDIYTLGVVIDPAQGNPARSWISDPIDETALDLKLTANGKECTAPLAGFARSNQRLYVDLYAEDNPCRGVVSTIGDLAGARLTYSVRADCLHYGTSRAPIGADGRCDTVRLPEVDRVALAFTSSPEVRTTLATLTAKVDGRIVTEADLFLEPSTGLPRPTPVVAWRYSTPTG